jgi:SAM-dependent methyltransferase
VTASDAGYYERQYRRSRWRRRGDQPLLNRTRLRELRRAGVSGTLVEIGAGEGYFAAAAVRAGFTVVAAELREEGVALIRSNHAPRERPHLVRADVTALPLASGCADAVAAWDVLEHLKDPGAAIAEAARVLKPGGVMGISTPNPRALSVRRRGNDSFVFRDPTHIAVAPMEHWLDLLHSAGLVALRRGYDGWWDGPYLGMPRLKFVWPVLAQLMTAVRTTWPFPSGENVIIWARKQQEPVPAA